MDLSNLKYAEGSRKRVKRLGRGDASGHGGTSTKGHKGQKARSGPKIKVQREGGQMPLNRRLPKFGFTNIFKKEWQLVNVFQLEELEATTIDAQVLKEAGLIRNSNGLLKILGNGELTKKIEVTAHSFSKSAEEKINSLGGKATKL
ncbi:50S ribosomal protein L15 [bacterium]|nr:50S ribosomal protein L15 [bacterium]